MIEEEFSFLLQLVEQFMQHYKLKETLVCFQSELRNAFGDVSGSPARWAEWYPQLDTDPTLPLLQSIVYTKITALTHKAKNSTPTMLQTITQVPKTKSLSSFVTSCHSPIKRPSRQGMEQHVEHRRPAQEQFCSIPKLNKKTTPLVSKPVGKLRHVEKTKTTRKANLKLSLDSTKQYDYELKILRREILQQIHQRAAIDEKGVESITETTFMQCAMCIQCFDSSSMHFKISYKSIMDLRATWGFHDIIRENKLRHLAPACYDPVHVCLLCAQLLQDTANYRPNTEEKKLRKGKLHSNVRLNASASLNPYALPPLDPELTNDMTVEALELARKERIKLLKRRSNNRGFTEEDDEEEEEEPSNCFSGAIGKRMLYETQHLQSNSTSLSLGEWDLIRNSVDDSKLTSAIRRTVTQLKTNLE